jgi:hypothetical protein
MISSILVLTSEDDPLVFIEFDYEPIGVIVFEYADEIHTVEVRDVCRVRHL